MTINKEFKNWLEKQTYAPGLVGWKIVFIPYDPSYNWYLKEIIDWYE